MKCPDCSATKDAAGHLSHDKTCPSGLALDRLMERDAQFFLDHPGATEFRRPLDPAEITELQTVGTWPADEELDFHGRVLVRQLAPGVRTRLFDECYAIPRTRR